MKKLIFLSLIGSTLIISCKKDKPLTSETTEVTTTSEGTPYTVDLSNSKIEWKGYKIFKSESTSNFGTMKFQSGDLTIKDGKLESGKFVADINSLENENLKDNAEQKKNLEDHLKSGDFFEVEKFPTASYEITKVNHLDSGDYSSQLEGNLTIKGITKPVSFKANVSVNNGVASISTEPTDINREDFGVKFSIPAKNGVLKDDVTLQISIKANEKK